MYCIMFSKRLTECRAIRAYTFFHENLFMDSKDQSI